MSTLKLFNSAFAENTTDYSELSKLAFKVGYLVHPSCSSVEVLEFLKSSSVDYGSTFYKSFDKVVSIDSWEIFLDQVKHYS